MWTDEKVSTFIAEYGFKPSITKGEVKDLPNILQPDEVLLGLLEGYLKGNNGALAIATNKRVIFYRKSFIGTVTKSEFPIRMITSTAYRAGIMTSSVIIVAANNETLIDMCGKAEAQRFNDIVHKILNEQHVDNSIPAQPQNNTGLSNVEQLEKLFELKQKGVLSDEEFQQQKAKLL